MTEDGNRSKPRAWLKDQVDLMFTDEDIPSSITCASVVSSSSSSSSTGPVSTSVVKKERPTFSLPLPSPPPPPPSSVQVKKKPPLNNPHTDKREVEENKKKNKEKKKKEEKTENEDVEQDEVEEVDYNATEEEEHESEDDDDGEEEDEGEEDDEEEEEEWEGGGGRPLTVSDEIRRYVKTVADVAWTTEERAVAHGMAVGRTQCEGVLQRHLERPSTDSIQRAMLEWDKSQPYGPRGRWTPRRSEMPMVVQEFLRAYVDADVRQRRAILDLVQGTANWHLSRQHRIGGSLMSAAIGDNPKNTPEEAIATMMGESTFKGNELTARGTRLEPRARELLQKRESRDFIRAVQLVVKEVGRSEVEAGHATVLYRGMRFTLPSTLFTKWQNVEEWYIIIERGSRVCRKWPWTAHSSDGDIYIFGRKVGIVEIKSPGNNTVYCLSPLYYLAQIQGGMHIHRVPFCLFVTYVEYDPCVYTFYAQATDSSSSSSPSPLPPLQVDLFLYDKEYCLQYLFPALHRFYFFRYIPHILAKLRGEESKMEKMSNSSLYSSASSSLSSSSSFSSSFSSSSSTRHSKGVPSISSSSSLFPFSSSSSSSFPPPLKATSTPKELPLFFHQTESSPQEVGEDEYGQAGDLNYMIND